ncbi:MAG: DNA-binding response regulator [Proteobacteria bacterium]|nr:MAG: DNA-binding response regulator [Pseudomonadota bacterium]
MPGGPKILAVDDNSDGLFALCELLKSNGYEVVAAGSGEEALSKLESELPDLILLDVNMPGIDGFEVTRRIKGDPLLRYIPVILLTAKDDLEDVAEGLSHGADDYIKKPYAAPELIARLKAAMRTRAVYEELKRARSDNQSLLDQVQERYQFGKIIGKSQALRSIFAIIEKIKDSDVPVLISGESGTGKELIAHAIHYNSPRAQTAFVIQTCSAFNENLLESELFGHVKGAFTGAVKDKQGLFEAADHGTFFLDELGEMSPALQVKLLRVLQDGTFTPVGATAQKKVNVRVVAATNRNLGEMIAKGTFREDLYYRLNVVNIHLPALRERRVDIPLLVQHFMGEISARTDKPQKRISDQALLSLCDYNWPGNIRELQNEVERLVLLSGSEQEIGVEHISKHIRAAAGQPSVSASHGKQLKDAIEELEKNMIREALERTSGNKSEAARELGISRSNLIAKVQAYNLEQ